MNSTAEASSPSFALGPATRRAGASSDGIGGQDREVVAIGQVVTGVHQRLGVEGFDDAGPSSSNTCSAKHWRTANETSAAMTWSESLSSIVSNSILLGRLHHGAQVTHARTTARPWVRKRPT